MSRPCKLQLNSSGAWRDLLRFDIDGVDCEVLQIKAAELLTVADPAGRISLRITMADDRQTALLHWTAKNGWVVVCP